MRRFSTNAHEHSSQDRPRRNAETPPRPTAGTSPSHHSPLGVSPLAQNSPPVGAGWGFFCGGDPLRCAQNQQAAARPPPGPPAAAAQPPTSPVSLRSMTLLICLLGPPGIRLDRDSELPPCHPSPASTAKEMHVRPLRTHLPHTFGEFLRGRDWGGGGEGVTFEMDHPLALQLEALRVHLRSGGRAGSGQVITRGRPPLAVWG